MPCGVSLGSPTVLRDGCGDPTFPGARCGAHRPRSTARVPGRTDGLEPLDAPLLRGRGCVPRDKLAKVLKRDMTGKHQGRMHGVPSSYNWAKHPRIGVGNGPERHGFHAISAWGQIYEDIHGSPARNVRVSCRDISIWILSKRTGKWRRCNASKRINGANYVEDFSGNASKPANLRNEAARSGLGDPRRRLQLPPVLDPQPREDRPARRRRRRLDLLGTGDHGRPVRRRRAAPRALPRQRRGRLLAGPLRRRLLPAPSATWASARRATSPPTG